MIFQAVSDVGCVRGNNEDMAYVAGRLLRDSLTLGSGEPPAAFAVSDGMGGYEGGEVASEIVCRSFAGFMATFKDDSREESIRRLKEWAAEANRIVLETAASIPALCDMGTTFVGLVFTGSEALLINVGDSRCYRIRDGVLKRLTTDHSERERTGDPTIPSNLIYNFMGIECSRFISDVTALTCLPGDTYILCSDGLSDMVDDDTVERLFSDTRALVEEAKTAGGKDNITLISISI